jgi:hypothetical protein
LCDCFTKLSGHPGRAFYKKDPKPEQVLCLTFTFVIGTTKILVVRRRTTEIHVSWPLIKLELKFENPNRQEPDPTLGKLGTTQPSIFYTNIF